MANKMSKNGQFALKAQTRWPPMMTNAKSQAQ